MEISSKDELVVFIENIRAIDKYIEMICMNGGCYQFHLFLKNHIQCTPLMNAERNHVVTEFQGERFDIRGKVEGVYFGMTESDHDLAESWSFHRTRMIQIGECSVCEEPIVI